MMMLLRFNLPAFKIPFNRFIKVVAHSNSLIEVHYYNDREDEISVLGYDLLHCWDDSN